MSAGVVLTAESKLARLVGGSILILIVLSLRIYSLIIPTTKVQAKVVGTWGRDPENTQTHALIKASPLRENITQFILSSHFDLENIADELQQKHEKVLFEDTLKTFSFSELVSNFWDAGAYFMSILILVGSSIVPITSCIFLLIFLYHELYQIGVDPSTRFRRLWLRRTFFLLETSSCFALVDLIFQSYVEIVLSNDIVLIEKFLGFHLAVHIKANPCFGISVGVFSTLCLMSCFPLVEYMTPRQKPPPSADYSMENRLLEEEGGETGDWGEAFSNGNQKRPLLIKYANMYDRPIVVYVFFSLAAVACVVATIMTWISLLLEFRLEGFTGIVAGPENDQKVFKPIHTGHGLSTNASGGNIPKFLGTVYFVVVVLIPCVVVCISLAGCVLPLTNERRSKFVSWVKGLFTFSGFDILLVSSIAAYLELNLVAVFVLDDQFHDECTVLKRLAKEDCIHLGKTMGSGMIWLIIAVIFQATIVLFLHLAHLKTNVRGVNR